MDRLLSAALAGFALLLGSTVLTACGDDDGGNGGGAVDAHIVYEASTERDNMTVTNVFTVDPTTGEFQQLTDGTGYDGQPAWNRDRSRIIFISDRGQERNATDLYTMNPDGSDVQRLTSTPETFERSPKYSPGGNQIALVARRGNDYWLTMMGADGTGEETLAGPYQFIEFPSWRRDGEEIYFAAITADSQGVDILSVNLESREVRTRISTPSADVCPHFTWDGEYMTYARSPEDPSEEPDIFRHDLDSDDIIGANDRRLTDAPSRDDYANPSPDDERFVFLSNRDGNFDLYLMDADGSNVARLTNTPDLRENVPDW